MLTNLVIRERRLMSAFGLGMRVSSWPNGDGHDGPHSDVPTDVPGQRSRLPEDALRH